MRRDIILWLILCFPFFVYAQNCGTEDTLLIQANSLHSFPIEIENVFNNDLSDPGQGVCGIEIEFVHQFSENLELWIISPDNDTVALIGDNTDDPSANTFFALWDISFVQCAGFAQPDSGYVAQWNNDQPNNFVNGGRYFGSYYPFDGCLEDFNSGPVNGTWTILVRNNPSFNFGAITNFRLIFCDPRGVDCCFADAGRLLNPEEITVCEGDSSLLLDLVPYYPGKRPDSLEFDYTYIISRNGIILEYDTIVDLRSAIPGNYEICGFSYAIADLANLPVPDGSYTLSQLVTDIDGLTPSFCGDTWDECQIVNIVAPPDPVNLIRTICEGDSIVVGDSIIRNPGFYAINLQTEIGCDSLVNLDLTVVDAVRTSLDQTICEGDSIVVGGSVYFDPGNYSDTLLTASSCDSIIELTLNVLEPVFTNLNEVICEGDTYPVGDSLFSSTGNYTVNLSSAQGCDSIVNLALNVLTVTSSVVTPVPIDCFNEGITLDGNASSPNGSITYQWTDINSTELGNQVTLPVVEAGSYILNVSQTQNTTTCIASDTVEVLDNRIKPIADAGASNTILCDQPIITVGGPTSSQGADFSYEWTTMNGQFAAGNTDLTVDVISPGEYSLVVSNSLNGCKDTSIVTIGIDTIAPIADGGPNQVIDCNNTSVEIGGSLTSEGPEINYTWSAISDGTPINLNSALTSVNQPDTYQLIVLNTDNACRDTALVTVGIDTLSPSASILPPAVLNCALEEIQLDASSSDQGVTFDFAWNATGGGNIIEGENTLTPTVNSAGLYELVVDNLQNGCEKSVTVSVQDTINAIIAAPGPGGTLNCSTTRLTLDGSGSTTGPNIEYEWSTTEGNFIGTTNTSITEVDAPGTYQLIVRDNFTFCADTMVTIVNQILEPPLANAGADFELTCNDSQVELDGSGSASGTGIRYLWRGNCIQSNPTQVNITINCPGFYSLEVFDDNTGCSSIDTVEVTENIIPPQADAGLERTITCTNPTVQLDGNNSNPVGEIDYSWSGPGIVQDGNTATPLINEAGIYTLIVQDTNNGCLDTALVEVMTDTLAPVSDAGPNQIIDCRQRTAVLGGVNTSTGPDFIYEWSALRGEIIGPIDGTSATVDTAGFYIFSVIDTRNGCGDTTAVSVTTNLEEPFADAGFDVELDCRTPSVTLDGSNSTALQNTLFEWEGQCIITPSDVAVIDVNCPGEYILTVTRTDNGCFDRDTVIVNPSNFSPDAVISEDTISLSCETGLATLDATSSSDGFYQWLLDGAPVGTVNPTLPINQVGTYAFVVSNFDQSCTDTAFVEVVIDCRPIIQMTIPDTIDCRQSVVNLSATVSPVGPNYTYQWIPDITGCIAGAANQAEVQAICGGDFTLIVTNTLLQVSDTASIFVAIDTLSPFADAGLPDSLTCTNEQVLLDGSNSSTGSNITYSWTNFSGEAIGSTPTVTVSAPGTYILEVLNSENGCTTSDAVQINSSVNRPEIIFTNEFFPCEADTFLLEAFVNPPGGNYAYNWQGPGILSNADSLRSTINAVGAYIFTVIDNESQCSAIDTAFVRQQNCGPCIQIASPDTLSCSNDQITLTANFCETCLNCTQVWSTSDGRIIGNPNNLSIEVNRAGTYVLTAFDELGASSTLSVEVFQDASIPVADAGLDQEINCRVTAVTLGGPNTSGGADIRYNWQSFQGTSIGNTANIVVQEAGNFVLEVINEDSGCSGRDTVIVTLDNTMPVADAGTTQILTCTQQFVSLDGGNSSLGNNIEYQWSTTNSSCIETGATSINPVVSCNGMYILTVLDTLNGCVSIDSVEVQLSNEVPEIPEIPDQELNCIDSVFILRGLENPPSDWRFQWCRVDDNNEVIVGSCVNQLEITVQQIGNYRFQVTDDQTGCSNERLVQITESRELPQISAGEDQTLLCGETSLQLDGEILSGENNVTINWSNPDNATIENSENLNPTVFGDGIYVLEVLNRDNQCFTRDSVQINLDINTPVVDAGLDISISCLESSLQLSGNATTISGQVNYLWSTPDGNFVGNPANAQVQIDEPGVYFLSATDPQNGCTAADSLIVIDNQIQPQALVDFPEGQSLNCIVDTLRLSATASQPASGNDLTYTWQVLTVGNLAGNIFNPNVEVTAVGAYRLVVANTINGCQDTLDFQIGADFQEPTVLLQPSAQITCANPTVTLDATNSSVGVGFSLQWIGPDNQVLMDTSPTPEVNTAGNYSLTIINENNGCQNTGMVSVNIDTLMPNIVIAEPGILDCSTTNIPIDASASSNGIRYIYDWTTTNGNILEGQGSSRININQAGIYSLNILDTINGCSVIESVEVIAEASAIDEVFFTVRPPSCDLITPARLTIDSVSGGEGPYFFALEDDILSSTTVFNNLKPGEILLRAEDASGCEWEGMVTIPDIPDISVDLGEDIVINLGDTARLEAFVSGAYSTLLWTPTEVFDSSGNLVQFVSPSETTAYFVEARDDNGCKDSDWIVVSVLTTRKLFAPTAFSPNGDGNNDLMMLYAGEEVSKIRTFKIFDRWGNQVYGKEEFQPNDPTYGWDGRLNGQPMDPAVFVFFAEVEYIDGWVEMIKGDVVLMR